MGEQRIYIHHIERWMQAAGFQLEHRGRFVNEYTYNGSRVSFHNGGSASRLLADCARAAGGQPMSVIRDNVRRYTRARLRAQ